MCSFLELLEHNMQQKQAQILEMQVELSALKEKAAKLQEELSSERVRAADLQDERTQARLELETTLKAQHKHLKELEAFRCAGLPSVSFLFDWASVLPSFPLTLICTQNDLTNNQYGCLMLYIPNSLSS